MIGRPLRVGRQTVDGVLALAFVVALEAEIVIGDRFSPTNVLTQVSVIAIALAIAGRRQWPVAAVTVSSAALVLQTAQGDDFLGTTMVAVAVCLWGAARHFERPVALAALGVAGAGFSIVAVLGPSSEFEYVVGDALWGTGIFALTWGVGRAFRRRRLQASALEQDADRLRQERDERARIAVSDERSRIARELHDIVAHNVSTMVVQAGAGRRILERDPRRAGEALESIEGTGRQALVELRRLLGILRMDVGDLALAPQPSLEHVDSLVEHVRDSGLAVELTVRGRPRPLPSGIDVSAYRIIQEGLTNAIKHAGEARVDVVVSYGEEEVDVAVVDDGRGAPGDHPDHGGHGLVGMRERVALYKGTLEAGPRNGGGFAIHARLPIEPSPP
jgi:signal transduction histidine kinase